jgi:hypothetical protein
MVDARTLDAFFAGDDPGGELARSFHFARRRIAARKTVESSLDCIAKLTGVRRSSTESPRYQARLCDMSAPDFYFVVNATARHILEEYGREVLIDYWRSLGREYYAERTALWREGGARAIANDWVEYFLKEPAAVVSASADDNAAQLDIQVCPAIKHLRDSNREIVPCFCEHCDFICGEMAMRAGFDFARTGGMGACQQTFTRVDGTDGR